MKKVALVSGLALAGLLALTSNAPMALAKVDCDQVMSELNSGKTVRQVASDLHVSRSSVYRCRRKAKMQQPAEAPSPAAAPSEAAPAAPSPAAAPSSH